jgi:hypothetical protein
MGRDVHHTYYGVYLSHARKNLSLLDGSVRFVQILLEGQMMHHMPCRADELIRCKGNSSSDYTDYSLVQQYGNASVPYLGERKGKGGKMTT